MPELNQLAREQGILENIKNSLKRDIYASHMNAE